MCLILLSWQQHPEQPLIIAANRDEVYARPTLAANFWAEHPQILAGRDLQFGGSWLGISRNGRFAAVTNLRDLEQTGERSRGDLVKNFLLSENSTSECLSQLETEKSDYRPFNFIGFDGRSLGYSNNNDADWQLLPPGTHAIGNIPLNSANEKTIKGNRDLNAALSEKVDYRQLLDMLQDKESTGQHEDAFYRALSCRFVNVAGLDYGTRSSSVLIQHQDGHWDLWEQLYKTDSAAPDFLQIKELKHFHV